MSSFVIFDTSIFIDHLRTGCHRERIESVSGFIRSPNEHLFPQMGPGNIRIPQIPLKAEKPPSRGMTAPVMHSC